MCVIEASRLNQISMPQIPTLEAHHYNRQPQVVKQEPVDTHFYNQQPASHLFNERELEEDRQIDQMIHSLKMNKVEYTQIMQVIHPYIEKIEKKQISKQSEQKLNNFLNELIKQKEVQEQMNNQVKRE